MFNPPTEVLKGRMGVEGFNRDLTGKGVIF
jgi:hypothetical protein